MSANIRAILLDIEGTTTPIAFVHDVLFPYARDHAKEFLEDNFDNDEVRADIALLREEHGVETELRTAFDETSVDSIAGYVEWLIARDRKSTGLKSLQGKIWRQGYQDGSLKSQVYADVAPALERWRARGLSVNIFSSGSVLAQKLLFAHTNAGNLTGFIDNYFDTNVGKKGDAESYRRIADAMNVSVNEILFVSDVIAELEAASAAGMKVLLSVRPGNPAQENDEKFQVINDFEATTIS